MEPTTTPNEDISIEAVQRRLSDMPDEEIQLVHDDIVADRDRFLEHVGIESGAAFLVHLLLEMRDRKMPVHESLPQAPAPLPLRRGTATDETLQLPQGGIPLTRNQRRQLKKKRRK